MLCVPGVCLSHVPAGASTLDLPPSEMLQRKRSCCQSKYLQTESSGCIPWLEPACLHCKSYHSATKPGQAGNYCLGCEAGIECDQWPCKVLRCVSEKMLIQRDLQQCPGMDCRALSESHLTEPFAIPDCCPVPADSAPLCLAAPCWPEQRCCRARLGG